MQDEARNDAGASKVSVEVWDIGVRVFHWLIVVLVFGAWLTSEIGGNAMTYHMWIGYSLLTFFLFRVVWGFVGGRYARFRDFVRGPVTVLRYLRGPPGDVSHGHNPAGGWSVLALLASLGLQAITGLFTNDEIMTEGPLAARVGSEWSDLLSSVHRYNFYVLLALVGLHLAAICFYLFVKRENLVKPMITGRKLVPASAASNARPVSKGYAFVVLACAAGAVAALVNFA